MTDFFLYGIDLFQGAIVKKILRQYFQFNVESVLFLKIHVLLPVRLPFDVMEDVKLEVTAVAVANKIERIKISLQMGFKIK